MRCCVYIGIVGHGLIAIDQWKFNVFLLAHATLMGIALPLLIRDDCNDHTIDSVESLGLQFISTKILDAKFSEDMSCVILPSLLIVNVTVLLIQHHVTITVIGECDHILSDMFCYIGVLGFAVVVLFDSQQVSTVRSHQEHVHVIGVVLLTVADGMLHALTILSCKLNTGMTTPGQLYVGLETVYIVTLVVFAILFTSHVPGAVQVEYAILVLFYVLSLLNLLILYRHQGPKPVLEASREPKQTYFISILGPVVIFALISVGFLVQFVTGYGYTVTFN